MATQIASVDFNGISNALKVSLDNWGKASPKYAGLYKTLSHDVLMIGHAALEEMTLVKPGGFEVWWAMQHNRFIRNKGIKQREVLLLHEIMYHFLTAFSRGQLADERKTNSTDTEQHSHKAKSKRR